MAEKITQSKSNKEEVLAYAKNHWDKTTNDLLNNKDADLIDDRFFDYLVKRFDWKKLSDISLQYIICEY